MGRRKRGWNAASELGLADLQRLIEAKHSELVARRSTVVAELEEIDAQLDGVGRSAPTSERRRPGRPPKSGRRPGRPAKVGRPKGKRGRPTTAAGQSDLHDRIRAAMKGASQPMKAADIAKKVLA